MLAEKLHSVMEAPKAMILGRVWLVGILYDAEDDLGCMFRDILAGVIPRWDRVGRVAVSDSS